MDTPTLSENVGFDTGIQFCRTEIWQQETVPKRHSETYSRKSDGHLPPLFPLTRNNMPASLHWALSETLGSMARGLPH